jgi:capsule polysaccharide export inner-membrane protein ctrB
VISQPNKPDLAHEPNRLYNIVATFVIGLIVYGIAVLLTASIREHKN